MERTMNFGFITKYVEHCDKFREEQRCVTNALEGKYPGNVPLPPPKMKDIINEYGEDARQDVVYLTAESWVLDIYGHRMAEPFMFSYRRKDDDVVFDK